VDDSPPRIAFPCPDYPISIMGRSGAALRDHVLATLAVHAPGFDAANLRIQPSRGGKYQALRVRITATGEPQLRALHRALQASDLVKMVL